MSLNKTHSIPVIHYVVKTGFNSKTQTFSEIVFSDEQPFLARKKAFEFMNNYVAILQENQLMRKTEKSEQLPFGEPDEYFYEELESYNQKLPVFIQPNDFPDGISLYMEVNEPINYMDFQDKKGDRFLIHSVVKFNSEKIIQMIDGLKREYGYFQKFKLDTYDNSEVIDFGRFLLNKNNVQNYSYTCLRTPMDWHFHYFVEQKGKVDDLLSCIVKGSLINNAFLTKISAKNIERELSSLLNMDKKGYLFLGISPTRKAKSVFDPKSASDMIRVHKTLIESMFPEKHISKLISLKTYKYKGQIILVYTVEKNLFSPIYTETKNGKKKFFIRNENGLKRISDIEEIVNHCFLHFEEKSRGIQSVLDFL